MPLHGNYIGATIPYLSIPFDKLKGKASEYLIILVVNPYERIPFGSADPAEMPPRLPYTLPAYTLQLMPVSETNSHPLGHFQLPVGKLKNWSKRLCLTSNTLPLVHR
jgi:hypothetical protein